MAKKTKRKVSTGAAPVAAPAPEVTEATPVETPIMRSAVPSRRMTSSTEFNPDYTYVINDLKRIGTLAGIFFVILIVLSFFL